MNRVLCRGDPQPERSDREGQGLRGTRPLVEDAVVQRLNDRAGGDRPGGVPQEPQTSPGNARGPSRPLRLGERETMHRRVRALLTMRVVLVLIAAGHAAAALAVIGYAGWGLWAPFSGRSDVAIVVVPSLSATAEAGRTAYDQGCLQCHGLHGVRHRCRPTARALGLLARAPCRRRVRARRPPGRQGPATTFPTPGRNLVGEFRSLLTLSPWRSARVLRLGQAIHELAAHR